MEKLLLLLALHFMALAMPGPDFAAVLRSSLSGHSKDALWCSVGIALGVASHLLLAYVGLSLILYESPKLYRLVVIAGSIWLLILGWSALRAKKNDVSTSTAPSIAAHYALLRGYLTNLLNPKALVYFISIISQIIQPDKDRGLYLIAATLMTLMTFIWFSLLAKFLNTQRARKHVIAYGHIVEKFFGVCIILLAASMLYSELIKLI